MPNPIKTLFVNPVDDDWAFVNVRKLREKQQQQNLSNVY
jgi:hypothetical protein